MHILLSCAKKQHSPTEFAERMPNNASEVLDQCRQPRYQKEAQILMNELRPLSASQLQALMSVSPALAALNKTRFADFQDTGAGLGHAVPALWLFAGDAYRALDAESLSVAACGYLDQHLHIVSGLYGFLSAFDWVQPYRLEMKTRLANPLGSDLYAYWSALLSKELEGTEGPIINLASAEYSQAVNKDLFSGRWIDVVFTNKNKAQEQKVIGIKAKKARGDMVAWMADADILNADQLKSYDRLGYVYSEKDSTNSRFVFREGSV